MFGGFAACFAVFVELEFFGGIDLVPLGNVVKITTNCTL
jgi:hypothetical protein